MRELRTCDFCDANAVGTFAIVPPELEPTEADQRRVVCCPDCRDRLETLLEPLLARLGVTDLDSTADNRPPSESVVTAADGAATGSRSASSNATVTDDTSAPAVSEGDSADSETDADASEPDPATDESEPTVDDPDSNTTSLDDGITLERGEQPDDTPTETATADQTAAETRSPASSPRAYRKVIRLLRNRELPMKRSAVEDLAAGAYDLESDDAAAIVDYAIEDGEFVEDSGKLHRP